MQSLLDWILRKITVPLGVALHKRQAVIAQLTLPRFANEPRNLVIELPRRIYRPERIYIGDDVSLGPGTLLNVQTYYPTETMSHPGLDIPVQRFDPTITIGHRVTATGTLTISAMRHIRIGDDVMFAANVFVTDGHHGYSHAREPYKYQPLEQIAPVEIKRGSWIGQNVVILPGVTIGECSIIGANSVVTESVPDRCIAVGAPAKIIKRWDDAAGRWVRA